MVVIKKVLISHRNFNLVHYMMTATLVQLIIFSHIYGMYVCMIYCAKHNIHEWLAYARVV